MFRFNLNKDAFIRPQESKLSFNNDYKLLYHAEAVKNYYTSDLKENNNKKYSEKYKKQFITLINALHAWGKKNDYETDFIRNKFEILKNNFFNIAYSGNQSAEYFTSIKLNLERIYFILTKKEIKNENKKKSVYLDLCDHLDVCAPGLYTHIEDALNLLVADISIEQWLADLRTTLIRAFADKHVYRYDIADGNSIHVYNAFLMLALNEGFNPLSNITQISDPFISAHTHLNKQTLENFFDYLVDSYTPQAILECICTNFHTKLIEYQKSFELKVDKEGWFSAQSSEFNNKSKQLAQLIRIDYINYFDQSDDYLRIRFNPNLFKILLLKSCRNKKQLFLDNDWNTIELIDGYSATLFDNHIGWIENENQDVLQLTTSSENIKLFSKLLNDTPYVLWQFIIDSTIKNISNFIVTAADLADFLIPFNEKDKINYFLKDICSSDFIKEKIYSTKDIFILVDSLKREGGWKANLVLKICKKNFLKYTVENESVDVLKRLLLDGPSLPIQMEMSDPIKMVKTAFERNEIEMVKIIVKEYRINLNKGDKAGNTLIHFAAKQNNPEIINVLASNSIVLDRANRMGKTPVIIAADEGHLKVLKALAENKANLGYRTKKNGYTAAHIAALLDNAEILEILAEYKVNLSCQTTCKNKYTPAHLAAKSVSINAISVLLQQGVSFDIEDANGESPLDLAIKESFWDAVTLITKIKTYENLTFDNTPSIFLAAQSGNKDAFIKLANWPRKFKDNSALKNIDLVSQKSRTQSTLAHIAAINSQTDLFPLLTEYKVDFHAVNKLGDTPAHSAVKKKVSDSVIISLSEYFWNFLSENNSAKSVIDLAYEQKDYKKAMLMLKIVYQKSKHLLPNQSIAQLVTIKGYTQLIPLLFHEKISISDTDVNGLSVVHMAVKTQNAEFISKLAEFKVDMNVNETKHNTPLHLAARYNYSNIIETLLRCKAEVNVLNYNKETPLFVACKNGFYDAMAILIKHKADLYIKNRDNIHSAFLIEKHHAPMLAENAIRENNLEVMKILIKLKINLNFTIEESDFGWTLAHLSIDCKREDMIQMLIDFGVNFKCKSFTGITPTHLAVMSENINLLNELIKNDCVYYDEHALVETPLTIAIERKKWDKVIMLLLYMGNKKTLHSKDKILIEQNKIHITTSVIKFLKQKSEEDRQIILKNITQQQNILGVILNKPSSSFFGFFNRFTRQGMTEEIYRIVNEFKEAEIKKVVTEHVGMSPAKT